MLYFSIFYLGIFSQHFQLQEILQKVIYPDKSSRRQQVLFLFCIWCDWGRKIDTHLKMQLEAIRGIPWHVGLCLLLGLTSFQRDSWLGIKIILISDNSYHLWTTGMWCACSVPQSCPTPCNPIDCNPPRLFCPWNFSGKNTGVGWHFLLQSVENGI